AWNKAVESEKEAINPRIILENDLGKFIESQLRERFNESVGEFYLDVDGKYVLSSYEIGAAFDYGKQIFEDGLSFQLTMINKLEANVTQYILDRRVLQKYLWIIKAIERNAFHPVKEESGELKLKIIECLLNT
ncbi:MAG TPA: hypothetical protein VFD03_05230, partial [Clostridia bacterium]|nr:hypothetical protein [Clostridia bacterium]